ncbi:MAG: diguanylate cyclase [Burkholderiaceae bacterium]
MSIIRFNVGPALRLAIGLAVMTTCLLIGLDMATGLVPDPAKPAARLRVAVAESIARQLIARLGDDDPLEWRRTLALARRNEPQIIVAALRADDGRVLASDGPVDRIAPLSATDRSTLNRMIVPIEQSQRLWGHVDIVFESVYPTSIIGWLTMPMTLTLLGMMALGVPLYGLYLRRALQLLDPSGAVPDRVRAAFDTLAEGVAVLDKEGRIVLANQIFRDMMPDPAEQIIGKRAAGLEWLMRSLPRGDAKPPWIEAIESNRVVDRIEVALQAGPRDPARGEERQTRRYVLRANPISDPSGARRGCIVTFDDVSELHIKNAELKRLASRDPMTDCLNRRAFFEEAAALWAQAIADGRSVTMAMCDIDFFKKVNDQHGHAAGDQVIKATADWLRSVSRGEDLVCRMGGEEFCVVWVGLPADQAMTRAEALRRTVETAPPILTEAGQALKVTMSVGVICARPAELSVEAMIENADQALYEAKRSGRNRVVQWPFTPSTEAEAEAGRAADPGRERIR